MKVPIRVMQVVLSLEIGGLEKMVVDLSSNLDSTKYVPFVCALEKGGALVDDLDKRGIKTITLSRKPGGIDYCLLFRLAKTLKREKIQLVHAHNSTAYFYSLIASKLIGVPIVIYTEHDRNFPDKKRLMLTNKLLSLMTDKIITVSRLLQRKLNYYEKISRERMETIVNGVDSRAFRPVIPSQTLRKKLGFQESEQLVGIIARLDPIKDHRTLLRAMTIIVREIYNVKLLIVGDGPTRDQLYKMCQNLGIEKYVFFLGIRRNIPEILAILDVFVLCSLNEGLSLTILEAMAASKPVVATNVGGNPELVKHGLNGLLVPPQKPEKLAEAIVEILKNKQKAQIMGESGRQLFEKKYTLERMVKNYEQVYDSCYAKKLGFKSL